MREGLAPFVELSLRSRLGKDWAARLDANWPFALSRARDGKIEWDSQAVLRAMADNWQSVFRETLGHAERSWVSELREIRNAFAHEKPFSSEDTYRALDTAQRLLASVGASSHAAAADSVRQELPRIISDQSARNRVKQRGAAEPKPQSGLRSNVSGSRKPRPENWMSYSVGRSGFSLLVSRNKQRRRLRASMYLSGTTQEPSSPCCGATRAPSNRN